MIRFYNDHLPEKYALSDVKVYREVKKSIPNDHAFYSEANPRYPCYTVGFKDGLNLLSIDDRLKYP